MFELIAMSILPSSTTKDPNDTGGSKDGNSKEPSKDSTAISTTNQAQEAKLPKEQSLTNTDKSLLKSEVNNSLGSSQIQAGTSLEPTSDQVTSSSTADTNPEPQAKPEANLPVTFPPESSVVNLEPETYSQEMSKESLSNKIRDDNVPNEMFPSYTHVPETLTDNVGPYSQDEASKESLSPKTRDDNVPNEMFPSYTHVQETSNSGPYLQDEASKESLSSKTRDDDVPNEMFPSYTHVPETNSVESLSGTLPSTGPQRLSQLFTFGLKQAARDYKSAYLFVQEATRFEILICIIQDCISTSEYAVQVRTDVICPMLKAYLAKCKNKSIQDTLETMMKATKMTLLKRILERIRSFDITGQLLQCIGVYHLWVRHVLAVI